MSVVAIDEIENLPNRPEVLLIDVRDPQEIKATGTIPTSINIPCKLHTFHRNFEQFYYNRKSFDFWS